VLITCVVCFFTIRASEEAKNIGEMAVGQMEEMNKDIMDSGIMKYDDNEVYGSDVINYIKKILNEYEPTETAPVYVYVKSSSTENTYTNNLYISLTDEFDEAAYYIKPTAVFMGEVVRNTNDVIIGIRFIQR
jgi:hypothetical protein